MRSTSAAPSVNDDVHRHNKPGVTNQQFES
jgi:hypothetical protein